VKENCWSVLYVVFFFSKRLQLCFLQCPTDNFPSTNKLSNGNRQAKNGFFWDSPPTIPSTTHTPPLSTSSQTCVHYLNTGVCLNHAYLHSSVHTHITAQYNTIQQHNTPIREAALLRGPCWPIVPLVYRLRFHIPPPCLESSIHVYTLLATVGPMIRNGPVTVLCEAQSGKNRPLTPSSPEYYF
jgi:hypothetical protein